MARKIREVNVIAWLKLELVYFDTTLGILPTLFLERYSGQICIIFFPIVLSILPNSWGLIVILTHSKTYQPIVWFRIHEIVNLSNARNYIAISLAQSNVLSYPLYIYNHLFILSEIHLI